ncbi:MAG: hypothetical protein PHT07_24000 [Paludibacter sp.]|nr:hypothetical protein [Paludibacter sp.]
MELRFTLKKRVPYPKEVLHFYLSNKNRIIARSSSGKIAIISYSYKGIWVHEGEDWLCEIIEEEEKKVIIIPVRMIKSSQDNIAESIEKIKKLKDQGFRKEYFKPKNSTLYKSS